MYEILYLLFLVPLPIFLIVISWNISKILTQQIRTQKDKIRCKKRSRIYFDSKKKVYLIFGGKKWVLQIIH